METLRTPDECFADLPGYPFEPHYTDVPDGDGGTLRVHHVDEKPMRIARPSSLADSCRQSMTNVVSGG